MTPWATVRKGPASAAAELLPRDQLQVSVDLRALADRLRALDTGALHVVTLPDFFLDHFVTLPAWSTVVPEWQAIHARGGGNILTPGQHFQPAEIPATAFGRMVIHVSYPPFHESVVIGEILSRHSPQHNTCN